MGTVTRLALGTNEPKRFVRVTDRDHRGFVEFQFSIGDPGLYLEMTLPRPAFEEFCNEHQVRLLSKEEGRQVDANERRWRFGEDEDEEGE
jgi:phenol/toluene 2-monooxygenase (NADH) P0/A0